MNLPTYALTRLLHRLYSPFSLGGNSMKVNNKKILYITLTLCVIGFLLTIFEFLALHDIHNEYVSTGILKSLNISISGDLPDWTSTKGEWGVVRVSYIFRFVFFVFCVIVLYKLAAGLKNKVRD
jgi:hypothetical protein